MRVVTLTCSNTEIVCALGCAHLLVGVDDHSDFPEDVVGALPRVGKDLDIDPEKVAALKPDLVIASLTVPGHEKVVARLAERKLPMLVLAPTSLAGTEDDIRLVGRVLGVPEAGVSLADTLRQAIGFIPKSAASNAPRVLVEWWPKPVIAAGQRSWINDLLLAAGARNPLEDRDVESTPLTDEEVVAMAPDAVVISWCGVPLSHYRTEIVTRRPAWRDIPAVKNGRVYAISEAFLGRPGPRLIEGMAALRQVVAACNETSSSANQETPCAS